MAYPSSVVGEGYFGKVHKRYYKGSPAAIKIVPFDKVNDEDLLRECRVYAKLNHKNVVKLLGPPERKSDGWHIPMPFIEGSTLHVLIFSSRCMLSAREKHVIILGMCEGLNYLHEKNIVHQDLKPDNIMVEHSTKQAVIIDLGLAKFIQYTDSGHPFSSGRNGGCFEYTAPEVFLRSMTRSRTSDVWSMGKVIAEVILEARLTLNDCRAEKISQLLPGSKYSNIVCQMLQESPERRVSMKVVLGHLKSIDAPGQAIDWIMAVPIVLGGVVLCAIAGAVGIL